MKQHLVLKLRRPLNASDAVPYWVDFINDKSVIRTAVDADIDRLMAEAGLSFWLTREYELVGAASGAAEREHGLDRTYRLIVQQDLPVPPGLVSALAALPQVEQVRALEVGQAPLPRPQREFSGMQSVGAVGPGALIHLPLARLSSRGDPAVKIAVLDTGVDLDHPELQGRIADRVDFVNIEGLDTAGFVGDFTGYDEVPDDEVGHGSHVAGIIAGRGLQMDEGVAPECRLMAVRVLATMKDGDRYVGAGVVGNINAGIKWAVDHGADVINMSLGIRHTGGGLPHEDVIRYALAHGVTVVAASGNDGTAERYYPGALAGVLAVGAADDHGEVTGFTSFGAPIAVTAPGLRVYSSFAHHGYAHASGTSQAAPFVAGLVGLLKSLARSRGARLANDTVQQILQHTSERADDRPRSQRAGFGLINAADALRLLSHQLA
jgi:thermitase